MFGSRRCCWRLWDGRPELDVRPTQLLPRIRRSHRLKRLPRRPRPKTADSADTGKTKLKGRLPAYYSKLVDKDQKQKIYEIDSSFDPKIKDLKKQMEALIAQANKQIKAVLTPEQQTKLADLIAEAKAKRKRRRPMRSMPRPPHRQRSANSLGQQAERSAGGDSSRYGSGNQGAGPPRPVNRDCNPRRRTIPGTRTCPFSFCDRSANGIKTAVGRIAQHRAYAQTEAGCGPNPATRPRGQA